MGFFFTSASAFKHIHTAEKDLVRTKVMAVIGMVFSVLFMILQLIPIPGLNGVHFGKESYIMLLVWIVLGIVFYLTKNRTLTKGSVEGNVTIHE